MKIKDISVQGIFLYKKGFEYEINDMIIYNDTLYLVTESFLGDEGNPPNESAQCKPYTEVHGINNSEDNDTSKVITTSGLREIINTMFRGLSLEGVVSTLNTNDINLDDLTDTGAYLLNINDNLLLNNCPLISIDKRVLLRVYKSAELTIQEIIDYNRPIIYYRYYTDEWSDWTFISNGADNDVNQVELALNQYQRKISEYANKIEQIENQSRIIFREIEIENPSSAINVEVIEDSIVQVGIMTDVGSNEPLQEWVTIDLSIIDTGIAIGQNESKIYFRVESSTNEKSNLRLEMRSPAKNVEIFKVLTSKNY